MNEDLNLEQFIESKVLEFGEVSRFAEATLTENITQAVLRKDINPGIRTQMDEEKLIVNIEIIVYYGVNIPQLCYDIQTRLKRELTSLTGLDVKAVNIRVEGIDRKD